MTSKKLLTAVFCLTLLYSCRTPGDVRTETTVAQRISELEIVVANVANTSEELRLENEHIKGQLERIEHLLLQKDQIIKEAEAAADTTGKKDHAEKPDSTDKSDDTAGTSDTDKTDKEIKADKPVQKSPVETLDDKYKKARAYHDDKKYDEALEIYADVAKSDSNWYKERAMFYAGVAHYDSAKYKESIISMQEFIDKYPKSKNVPTAIFIQGESFVSLKQKEEAKVFFNDLIVRFPNSKEAQKAKSKIKNL